MNNIPSSIRSKVGANLHNVPHHPIRIIKERIQQLFLQDGFELHDDISPYVAVADNFDALLIPSDHPSRADSDTFYSDESTVLRTHTSAHQTGLLKGGSRKFLVTGDVYRKDAIDKHHYPVFHQMEGVCVVGHEQDAVYELKVVIKRIIESLFEGCNYVIREHEFPFTDPSFEVDVEYNGEMLEVLGCGKVRNEIMSACGLHGEQAWAFGLGLERLAMVLFDIPDIRYFWTSDPRFIDQFKSGDITKFKEYSKFPICYKDIAFWVNAGFNENDMSTLTRELAGDTIEKIELIDRFEANGRTSHCYRFHYRSNDRSLTNDEVDVIQGEVRKRMSEIVELR